LDIDPYTIGLIGTGVLTVLIVLGVHVVYAAALVGIVGLSVMRGMPIGAGVAGMVLHAETSKFALSVLPMFILIGYFAFYGGMIHSAYAAALRFLGWLPGGLAFATVAATAGFAAVSGASTATAAVFSRIAIPQMLANGYHRQVAGSVVAAGGTLASLIPPSAILVIYGILVEQSVGRLLLAGFIPGALTALLYCGAVAWVVWRHPEKIGGIHRATWSERLKAIPGVMPIVMVISVIFAGLYGGLMTPTECGAVGAAIVLIHALVTRRMSRADFSNSVLEAAKLTGIIFAIIWGVLIFARFLSFSGVVEAASAWIVALPLPPLAILLLILGVYLILGMFMDGMGMLLLTLPIVYPAIVALGYDPIWFGIILVKMVEIGLVTPPVGLNCYVVRSVRPDIPLGELFRGVVPFIVADVVVIALLIAFPEIALVLPDMLITR
jgi:tripartite ATP-independent transporter DctM subunit